jgi:hypothetical protein
MQSLIDGKRYKYCCPKTKQTKKQKTKKQKIQKTQEEIFLAGLTEKFSFSLIIKHH